MLVFSLGVIDRNLKADLKAEKAMSENMENEERKYVRSEKRPAETCSEGTTHSHSTLIHPTHGYDLKRYCLLA